MFTAGGASRSRRDEHTLCHLRDATALPTAVPFRLLYSQRVPQYRHGHGDGDSAAKRLRLATPCRNAPGHVLAPLCMLLVPPPPQGSSSRACSSRTRRRSRRRVLCSLIPGPADRRQQPQPQLLLSADSLIRLNEAVLSTAGRLPALST